MNNYNRLINNLNTLGLTKFSENIDTYIKYINNGSKTIVDALFELSECECSLRQERAMNVGVKVANFPFLKPFDDFNFSFQPSINKEQLINYKYLKFIENKENIIFIGSPRSRKNTFSNFYWNRGSKSKNIYVFYIVQRFIITIKKSPYRK